MVPYLQDVCTVEMLCDDLKKKINRNVSEIREIRQTLSQEVVEPREPRKQDYHLDWDKLFDGGCYSVGEYIKTSIKAIVIWAFGTYFGFVFVAAVIWLIAYLVDRIFKLDLSGDFIFPIAMLITALFSIGIPAMMVFDVFEDRKERFIAAHGDYEEMLMQYHDFQNSVPELNIRLQEIQTVQNELNSQLKAANQLRENIYGVNIVPARYRNIYISYYLYDYFKTSREDDLDKIIQTLLLDEIRKKTAKLITQNQEMIILQRTQLAMQESQNAMLSAQHEERLQHMIQIEENQERQLDYQKMIEVNQEVTNFLLAADFYRKTRG